MPSADHHPARLRDLLALLASGDADEQMVTERLLELRKQSGMGTTTLTRDVTSILAVMEDEGRIDPGTSERVLARLATETTEPRLHLVKLKEIVQAASGSEPLQSRFPIVTRLVTETMGMDACTLFLLDETTNTLALRAATGMDPSTVGAVTLRIGNGIVGNAASGRRTVVACRALEHEDYHDHPGLTDEVFASQLSSPLIITEQSRTIGVISVHTLGQRDFTEDDIEFLETVAGVLAVSIDSSRQSARTDDRLQQKIVELTTLQRVSRVVASSLDLTEVLKLITEQAVQLIQAEAASIFRSSDGMSGTGGRRPSIEYRVGRVRSHEDQHARDAIVQEVLRTGVARTRDIAYADSVNTVFCLPLNTARETVGALCFRLGQGTILDEEQLGLLQAFGDAAALAIDNAQLYQEAVESIRTKSALVQEMHHRVRNNLQTVAALLSLQQRAREGESWTLELGEAVSRIQAIAGVHDLMSDEARLAGTTIDMLARMVAEDAHSTLTPPGLRVEFDIEPSELRVPSRQATIIALLINELTANAIHHGFRDRDRGRITITAREDHGVAVLEVANDGARIPEHFDPVRSTGLGMRITQQLVTSDLHGEFSITPTDEGTLATIRFPLQELVDEAPGQTSPGA
jgi:two-component system, sensor histidine kinase PdtaS